VKRLLPLALITIILLSNCKKSGKNVDLINCDGLVTDTSGTGDNGRLYIPNAFSPNGDGLNDQYRIIVKNVSSIALTIYDGNNNILFTTNQLYLPDQNGFIRSSFWASTNITSSYETFYYKIQAVTSNGRNIGACGELYKLSCRPSSIPATNLFFEDQLNLSGLTGITNEPLPICP
jgi:hypothetical protein